MPSAIFNAGRHKPEAYFGSLDALSSWLHQYEPRTITLALWLRIRSFVIAAVLEMAPQHRYEAYQGTHFLAEHTAWCLLQGIPLDRERVLHPDAVERSVSASGRSVHDKGSYRFYLSKYGRALTRHAPWPPPKERIPYAGLVPPYPPSQLSALRRAARSQTPLQNRRSTALIAMCAGAGLDGRSAADVKPAAFVTVRRAAKVRTVADV